MSAAGIVRAVKAWFADRMVERLKREKAAESSRAARFARVGLHLATVNTDWEKR